ncbi:MULTISPECIES: RluA family pseudouridine synthase [unclassified Arcicella]|uniref:RluA family pseudouridine synthase n=1 Tax=unclassified Arcicella TaxID=2644986 RepID=UPI00285F8575|nr:MULTISPECIES: RluA family pseudouridine synthase [unclassified Arcicella]MDR6562538.1 23S rRNA pseudouridine1911/1915/1917 synthase [Arcicella sp. BE51]MDR6812625.1 23S rRNA pseudouridine1911/1915/1917 synthase [Arcicella sp. BE140]MDR6823937.1 23S rRNA pseudouridine1911/1915/1917 synthase [Arcicella sp. BE139]
MQEIEDEEEELYQHHRFEVDKGQSILRIDKYLMSRLQNASRNKIQDAIETAAVRVNDAVVKANYKVKPLDVITVLLPEPPRNTEIIPQNIPLDIVYEDEELLVVNKPAGMVVHPAHGNWEGTLVNALIYHFQNLPTHRNGEIRPGLVHRIDKDTSGLLVIAKTDTAMTHLAKQFYDHSIERTYNALIWGEPKADEGTITGHVGRSLKDRKVMAVFSDGSMGKDATTHYKVLKKLRYVSVVQCNLETGRTHQIRVHFKHIGHPLFNDATYGGDRVLRGTVFSKYEQFVANCFKMCPRQALHAKSLGFIHPKTGEFLQFDTELPEEMQQVIQKWETYVTNE